MMFHVLMGKRPEENLQKIGRRHIVCILVEKIKKRRKLGIGK